MIHHNRDRTSKLRKYLVHVNLTTIANEGKQFQSLSATASPAAMRSVLPLQSPPVPSSNLLKFLKSQSERICFFSPNPRGAFIFDHAAPRGPQLHPHAVRAALSSRGLSTTASNHTTLEAGFLNLDSLFPRSALSIHSNSSNSSRLEARSRRLEYAGSLVAQRSAHTGSKKWRQKWQQKIWEGTSAKGGNPLRPDDIPKNTYGSEESGDTSMFSLGRHISAKAAAQPKLRCTELDENGNISMASGEFKKSELIAKVRHHSAKCLWTVLTMIVWASPPRSPKD